MVSGFFCHCLVPSWSLIVSSFVLSVPAINALVFSYPFAVTNLPSLQMLQNIRPFFIYQPRPAYFPFLLESSNDYLLFRFRLSQIFYTGTDTTSRHTLTDSLCSITITSLTPLSFSTPLSQTSNTTRPIRHDWLSNVLYTLNMTQ